MRGPGCWLLSLSPQLSALLRALAAGSRGRRDLSREAELHEAAGGSAGPSWPAQPEILFVARWVCMDRLVHL